MIPPDDVLARRAREEACQIIDGQMASGRPISLQVSGHSMLPLLREGDTVSFEKAPIRPWLGDILLVPSDSNVRIVHRLIWIRRTSEGLYYVLKGDSVLHCDAAVPASRIVGRAISITRGVRTFALCGHNGSSLGKTCLGTISLLFAGIVVKLLRRRIKTGTFVCRFLLRIQSFVIHALCMLFFPGAFVVGERK